MAMSEPTEEVFQAQQGLLTLLVELAHRFGPEAIQAASTTYAMVQQPAWEVRVPADQTDEASQFVTDLLIKIEDQYRENYGVVVLAS